METSEKTKKECPQCEGSGQEELGVIPNVCRKCGGAGMVAVTPRFATIMCGGSLEKTAKKDEFDGNEDEGTGVDEVALGVSQMSEEELKMSIMQLVRTINPEKMTDLFKSMCKLTGTNEAEAKRNLMDDNGEISEFKFIHHIANSIGTMTTDQLTALYCEIRRFT